MVNTEIRLTTFFVAEVGSDHQLLIAKFRLTLKKVGKNHYAGQV